MNLKGKTLLLMGGGAYAQGIKKYKDKTGFRAIAVGRDTNTPIAEIADSFYHVDTQNIDEICDIVRKERVDGIFVGSSEVNISPAIDVAEKTGCRFYVNREQWDIISNKAKFKEFGRKYNLPVVPEYSIPDSFTKDDIAKLHFPVLIKPTDSSGARGLNACYRQDDFEKLYTEALRWSRRKEIIVEELITDAVEVFVHYTIQDGVCSLSSAFTKDKVISEKNYVSLPIFHMYPSTFIDQYYEQIDENAKRMFNAIGLQNGVIMLQGFYKDGKFMFFESGYRMGGEQMYILTDYMWGLNSLEFMINYALVGKMSEERIADRDNARYPYPCCNYYVALKAGKIARMDGIDEVRRMDGVLNVTEMSKVGDIVEETNALERICLRIHVVGDSADQLAKRLEMISSTLQIVSEDGVEMQIEPLKYDRCFKTIGETTTFQK
ncbi:MAG: hypothetical protein ACOYH0_02595 [Saccharofermentanales bacterium]